MRTCKHYLGLIILAALVALGLNPPRVARAGNITVCVSGCNYSSIQAAINNANPGDTIILAAETFTEGDISVDKSLTIRGQGAGVTIVQAAATQAAATARIFNVSNPYGDATVIIENMTIRHGNPSSGSAGALFNEETLTLRNCSIKDNTSGSHAGGAIINHLGNLTLVSSTVSGNTSGSHGGGIYNEAGATLTLKNSTISGNKANLDGGGIYNAASTVHLYYSTITGNTADDDNSDGGDGGGIYNYQSSARVYFYNTIVAGNDDKSTPTVDDCGNYLGSLTSMDYNLVGNNTGCPSDKTHDQTTSDAKLGPLAPNGGRTRTHSLLSGSPAIDQIPDGGAYCGDSPFDKDQRDKTRPVDMLGGGSKCDVGAYERQNNESTAQNSTWTQSEQYDFGSSVNVKMTPNSGDPGAVTVLKRGVYPGLSQDVGEFPIVWTLSASGSGYNLGVALCYTADELTQSGVGNESTITAYRWDESTRAWIAQSTTPDPANNCVTVSNVLGLSSWTVAGDSNDPTAVTLRSLAATSARGTWTPVVLLVTALVGVALALRRRGAVLRQSK